MTHEHAHHTHGPHQLRSLDRAFLLGIGLNILFVAIEFGAGFWLHSLALLSDAGHNLTDVVSLALAMLAFRLARANPNPHYTYGYKKSTILVSLVNAIILIVAVGGILVESLHKLEEPSPVDGSAIAWVAGVGVVINALTALLFIREKERDLNVKGAYLHMAADALVSVGVLVSGVVIRFTGWYVIDPLIGLLVAVVIFISSWGLLRDSIRLILDGVPSGIDGDRMLADIRALPDVLDIHHVHIWAISTTENALTAHVVLRRGASMQAAKQRIREHLSTFGISHATLEIESEGEHCQSEAD
ncbi:MAG: cation diffusion facilitator family transporter [Prevotellaceae bacterium]|jgi:cobalt-zinc-cadmium efflux system protein|nr:cation diffusion facilitator family transporter [Prevotellaceae bacterium]